jgi:hypothetical protein
MTTITQKRPVLDGLAIGASTLCLVHCLVLPVVLLLVPTLAAVLAVPEEFHVAALAFALPASIAALLAGLRRHHEIRPAIIVVPGLVLLALGALLAREEWVETVMTVAGALLLSIGHALNWRSLQR